METITEMNTTDFGLQRLWGRRLTGSNVYDEDIAGLLDDRDVFPSAQVEVDSPKSRCCSPGAAIHEFSYQDLGHHVHMPDCQTECFCKPDIQSYMVDGAKVGDIPAAYQVNNILKHEFPVIGLYIDQRITPGFKYKVRPLQDNGTENWLFKGRALALESIGRGFAKRITFKADKGELNDNGFYFWTDSRPEGFAFEIEVVSEGDKFTIFDTNRVAVGTLQIMESLAPQEEIGHRILSNGVEKTVRIQTLSKVEWYEEELSELTVQMSGIAVSTKSKQGIKTHIFGVNLGNHIMKGFLLEPGVDNRFRSICVKGAATGDVPTSYTITGLNANELPVIGTYVDSRILPGFCYRVTTATAKRKPLFGGRALRLISIGMGYAKRFTFASDSLNHPDNYFWSDSCPDGFGFEPCAVSIGMKFSIYAGSLRLGEAHVLRTDGPQQERCQELVKEENGIVRVTKYIHVELTCHITLDTRYDKSPELYNMRISGNAVLSKTSKELEASILRIENIGLASQLNILFLNQWGEFYFIPI